MERWEDVEGYEGIYQISSGGRLNSSYVSGIRKPRPLPKGYLRYQLVKDGISKDVYAHRLVAMAFIDNPLDKPQVNHINGIKTDNRVENLEWCTASENMAHAERTGLMDRSSNEKPVYSLTTGEWFRSAQAAERALGMCKCHINRAIRLGQRAGGHRWSRE